MERHVQHVGGVGYSLFHPSSRPSLSHVERVKVENTSVALQGDCKVPQMILLGNVTLVVVEFSESEALV